MVSFQCDFCGDVVKKPKLDQHGRRCGATFTCIDCSTTFQGTSYKAHTSCISEAEKYQKSLYKKKGNNNAKNGQNNKNIPEKAAENKPLSLVEELKKKKEEASVGEKRKQESDKPEANKKAKSDKWEETELPTNVGKALESALAEAIRTSKGSLSVKDARKKVIKLLASHPKSSIKDKKDIKEKFDELLLFNLAGDAITLKTA